ncbi:ABC transporter permease [Kribbella sp.]|uniref:ABC transporter permease n=1 Tax=Kribbella sp. TaxID=1871183 RepID=UPI002D224317|nr:ABC transporter permease [Kribbella sp.]HZX07693.1 ABC transporter permease [Kribbella sp.]
MLTLISKRLMVALGTILGASLFSFVLLRKLPGDPARLVGGELADATTIDNLRAAMGLNNALPVQFWDYLSTLGHGNLGFSYSTGQNVVDVVRTRLPATVELGLTGVTFAVVSAVVFAAVAVYRRKRGADVSLRIASSLAMGSPPFWLALVAILLLAVKLGVFPGPEGRLSPGIQPPAPVTGLYTIDALMAGQLSTFFNALWHLVLPGAAIAVGPFAFLSRLFRSQLRTTVREPFVLVARSRGITRRKVFVRHVVPNSLLPLVAATAMLFAELMTGSVLIEKVFGWPGVGSLTVDAILQKDFAVVQGVILLSAVLYVTVSFLADIAYAAIDPRIRAGAR